MKMTLLDMVQDILNDMDGDEVSSIDDTPDSQQVAQVVKTTYYALMNRRNWPHLRQAIKLSASGTTDRPTHMQLEDEVKELVFINYDKARGTDTRKKYGEVTWAEPDDFLRILNGRNDSEENVTTVVDPSGVELFIRNDIPPSYYTSFNDATIVFDSHDSEVDTTLQNAKVQAYGYVIPSWSMADDFIPDLPDEAFTLLLEESKSKCSFKFRQVVDQKAEMEAKRQDRWLSRKAWRVQGGIKYNDYGRKGRK